VAAGESGRLRVLAAAERARSVGRSNPPGLFASLLRRGLWSHITMADEDAAARRSKAHLHGPPRRAASPPAPGPLPPPSADAELVGLVRSRVGGRADPFHVLRRESAGWTRDRYDRAVGELEAARVRRAAGRVDGGIGSPAAGSPMAGLRLPWLPA